MHYVRIRSLKDVLVGRRFEPFVSIISKGKKQFPHPSWVEERQISPLPPFHSERCILICDLYVMNIPFRRSISSFFVSFTFLDSLIPCKNKLLLSILEVWMWLNFWQQQHSHVWCYLLSSGGELVAEQTLYQNSSNILATCMFRGSIKRQSLIREENNVKCVLSGLFIIC